MNGRLRTAALGLVAVVTLVAGADDRDLYERLGATLIYSDDFSNEEVHRLVAKGIASDDPEIVELTLDAIGAMAEMTILGMEMESLGMLYGPSTVHTWPKRALADVPELKVLLMQRFELELDAWGGKQISSTQRILIRETLIEMPGWHFIPAVLALHWSGNSDVENLLLELPLVNHRKVLLLNAGGFTSVEANAVRREVLGDDSIGRNVRVVLPHDPHAGPEKLAELGERAGLNMRRTARLHALQGLALSRSPEAIPHLIALGVEQPIWGAAILQSLDSYENAKLMPHRQNLKDMLSEMRLFSLGQRDPRQLPGSRTFGRGSLAHHPAENAKTGARGPGPTMRPPCWP